MSNLLRKLEVWQAWLQTNADAPCLLCDLHGRPWLWWSNFA